MSIRSLNKWLSHPGCVIGMTVGLMVTMIVGFSGTMRGCGGTNQGAEGEAAPDKIVAKVEKFQVSENNISALAQNLLDQHSQGKVASAEDMFNAYGGVIVSQVSDGMNLLVAKKEGIEVTDNDVLKAAQIQIDMEMMQMKYKFGAKTDDDLSKIIQQIDPDHLTLDGYKKKQIADIEAGLKDPIKRASMTAEAAPQVIRDVLAARSKPSDDVLKASFISITAQRILFKGNDIPDQVAAVKAAEGKEPFEALMDRYSKADTTKGKKEHDMTVVLTQFQLLNAAYAPLLKLKVGDVSDALLTPEGTVIYKVQKIEHPIPKDFDKSKVSYGSSYAEQIGTLKYDADLDQVKKSVAIDWQSLGWKSAYEFESQQISQTMTDAEKQKAVETALADAKQAVTDKNDTTASKVAGLTAYVAVRELIKDAGKDGPTKYAQDHIDAIKNIEDAAASPALFLELAEACATIKDAAGTADALTQAANMNTNYDADGVKVNKDISDALTANAALLNDSAKKQIGDMLKSWAQTKADQEKALADQKKEEEANQAAQKKQFEQAAKDAKKPGAPASGPPTPPTAPPTPKKP